MNQLTVSLSLLLRTAAGCFRLEVFQTFCRMVGAWIVCGGRRTISRVWETTGLSEEVDHSAAFRLFSSACWNWDDVCRVLLLDIVHYLIRGQELWLVVDDTLCHKRGKHVAFGGMFLDPVLSSTQHKVFRFGNNWVTLGVVVVLPFRRDRYFCLNLLWRVYEKKGSQPVSVHRTKPQLAAEMVANVANWLPKCKLRVVGDIAYVGRALLRERAANVEVIGPLRWDAALMTKAVSGAKRCRRKRDRFPTPRQIQEGNDERWPSQRIKIVHRQHEKELDVKVVRDVYWNQIAGPHPLMLVLIRDPEGDWRSEALLSTDTTLTAEQVVEGYCRRWSVEVAYADSKGLLGLHDPEVWCEKSIERAHPMAWYVGSLVVVWYSLLGHGERIPKRHRPWYPDPPDVTFADMLATCRYDLWTHWLASSASEVELRTRQEWLLEYFATAL